MTPALLLTILGVFQAAITAAPKILAIVEQAKAFFAGLFAKGVITKEQQIACAMQLDAHAAMVNAGIVPPPWQVEPDPDEVTGGPVP